MVKYSIYTLTCPIDGLIKYVGMTKFEDLDIRLKGHVSVLSGSYDKINWIGECRLNNLIPKIELIECVFFENFTDAEKIELYWIHQFKQWGFSLVNNMYYLPSIKKGLTSKEYESIRTENNKKCLKLKQEILTKLKLKNTNH